MDEDLHTLCRMCHNKLAQYTCPRCSLRTCSLACIQIHKRRAPCTGVRDPTVYKPMRELATPAGIDHDYNFLSAIERKVERSDKLLVEDKGIVTAKELREGPPEPRQFSGRGRGRGRGGRSSTSDDFIDHAQVRGENDIKIQKECHRIGCRVERLPKGMARQKANGTSWSRKQKCVVWQVEWLRQLDQGEVEMIQSKILTTTPIGIAYANLLEERRRAAMTPEEKAAEKKKRAAEVAEKVAKRPKTEAGSEAEPDAASEPEPTAQNAEAPQAQPPIDPPASSVADSPLTATDTPPQPSHVLAKPSDPHAAAASSFVSAYTFYLHRPHTPVHLPTVLIPLDSSKPLDDLLTGKVIVEFPTVYVFPKHEKEDGKGVPKGFMSEDEFFRRMKEPRRRQGSAGDPSSSESEEEGEEKDESSDEDEGPEEQTAKRPVIPDSDTSSSGSSDESSEEESSDEEDVDKTTSL